MVIKQFKTNNNFSATIDYLNGKEQHNGKCTFFAGDDIRKTALLSENKYSRKYDVFCLSFSKNDSLKFVKENGEIDTEKLMKITDNFEHEVLCNGGTIDREKIGCSWYLHWDKGRIELNGLMARQTTDGKHFNPLNVGHSEHKFKTPEFVRADNWQLKTNILYKMDLPEENEWKIRIKGKNPNNAGELKINNMDRIYEAYINHLNSIQHKFNNREEFINYLKKSGTKVITKNNNGKKYTNGFRIVIDKNTAKYYANKLGITIPNKISSRYIQNGACGELCLNSKEKLADYFAHNSKSNIARMKGLYMQNKNNETNNNNIISLCNKTINEINKKLSKNKNMKQDNVINIEKFRKPFMSEKNRNWIEKEINAYNKLEQKYGDTAFDMCMGILKHPDFMNIQNFNFDAIISGAINLTDGIDEYIITIDPRTGQIIMKPNPLWKIMKEKEAEMERNKLSQSMLNMGN